MLCYGLEENERRSREAQKKWNQLRKTRNASLFLNDHRPQSIILLPKQRDGERPSYLMTLAVIANRQVHG